MSKFYKKETINPFPFPPFLLCVLLPQFINIDHKSVIPFIASGIRLIRYHLLALTFSLGWWLNCKKTWHKPHLWGNILICFFFLKWIPFFFLLCLSSSSYSFWQKLLIPWSKSENESVICQCRSDRSFKNISNLKTSLHKCLHTI